jgi:predicted amidophosphoribosyltransferase
MHTVRHCRRCGSDYRPEIERCGECGGRLEDRAEAEDARWDPPPGADRWGEPLAPSGDLSSIFYSYELSDLAALARRLADRQVPFRIEPSSEGARTPRTRYDLLVPEPRRADALREVEAFGGAAIAVESDFDPQRGYRSCPACSTGLPERVDACPDCGLALRGSPEDDG